MALDTVVSVYRKLDIGFYLGCELKVDTTIQSFFYGTQTKTLEKKVTKWAKREPCKRAAYLWRANCRRKLPFDTEEFLKSGTPLPKATNTLPSTSIECEPVQSNEKECGVRVAPWYPRDRPTEGVFNGTLIRRTFSFGAAYERNFRNGLLAYNWSSSTLRSARNDQTYRAWPSEDMVERNACVSIPICRFASSRQWKSSNGSAPVIISRMRELAMQIHSVVGEIFQYHLQTHCLVICRPNRKAEAENWRKLTTEIHSVALYLMRRRILLHRVYTI